MRCLSGNTWNARLFAEGTCSSPSVMRMDKLRCCSMLTTSIEPQRLVDDTDSDRTLLLIAARSTSLRIECIRHLLPFSSLREKHNSKDALSRRQNLLRIIVTFRAHEGSP